MAKRFERLTLYLDVVPALAPASSNGAEGVMLSEVELLRSWAVSCAAAVADEVCIADASMPGIPIQRFSTTPSSVDETTSLNLLSPLSPSLSEDSLGSYTTTERLLRKWQAEEADVYTREVENLIPHLSEWECLFTRRDTTDGAVAYALHHRQMPVLSLAATRSEPSAKPRSSIETLLLTSLPPNADFGAKKAAVAEFFTFPRGMGTFTRASADVSSTEGTTVGKDVPTSSSTAVNKETASVVLVNRDGYPVKVNSDTTPLLPPPPTRFGAVLRQLCTSEKHQMTELRARQPLLPGMLRALHRYENRGVLRVLLHRGYQVEVVGLQREGEDSESAVTMREERESPSATDEEHPLGGSADEDTLANFESKWLGLPLPRKCL